jgi:hypothetical protein
MYKIIGADRKEYGPVSADQIRQWIREGRANGQTVVQAQDSTEWKSLSGFAEFSAELAPPPFSPPPLPPLVDDAVPESAASFATRVGSGDYRLILLDCLRKGWELFKAHAGMLIGAHLIVLMISMGCQAVPFVGVVASVIFSGPLFGGLYLLNLKLIRGEEVSIGDLFDGFNRCFAQLMLGQIMIMLISTISAFLFIVTVAVMIVFRSKIIWILGSPIAFVGLLPAIYLTVCWTFTLPLIIDKGLDFWPAMELSRKKVTQHFGPVCILVVIGLAVTALGSLFFLIGALLTLPIFIASMSHAYEDIFNAR